ncbi:cell division protein FtsA [Acetoanaerobium noterae]|uniref:cell division protein FtsA n=1 Tax=Acetoanaerobium noterae TaxID=745369 RepID=UPI0028A9E109|nr:cell division FtsA domain-containing protein [Acetoanaerobium noterae]
MTTIDNQNKIFFCLDIGTRSIMGIVAEFIDDKLNIIHSVTEFHKDRVMLDGQIHDIEGVTKIARLVKEKLESEIGYELKEVSIAAAGRSLKTIRTDSSIKIEPDVPVDKHILKSLEIESIQKARQILVQQDENNHNYYNVGHTVINYMLDNSMIINPLGHKGSNLYIEIIATFLPQIVVDGLYKVMDNIGLDVGFMTLEPIAAIEAAVPNNIRLLNVALVDIGAGTSDIAITKDGTIAAYAMTSTAGDEITEMLAKTYLLDFDTAEAVKCNLCNSSEQSFNDILGINQSVASADILDTIEPSIESVASEIAENIIKHNGKSPSAVFLIGGASQIPRLNNFIASKLELPKERVAIKTIEAIPNLIASKGMVNGPEGVTPIGIILCTSKNKRNDFIEVRVNDSKVKMFRSKKLKISDAIILAGFDPIDLIPRKGKSLKIYVNNTEKLITGEYGKEANIFLNGKIANLDSDINDGDSIIIDPAIQGKHAKIYLNQILDEKDVVYLKKEPKNRIVDVTLNGKSIDAWDCELNDNDKIDYKYLYSVKDLFDYYNIGATDSILVNEKLSELTSPLVSGCEIDFMNEYENLQAYDIDEEELEEAKENYFENLTIDTKNDNVTAEHNKVYNDIGQTRDLLYTSFKIKYNDELLELAPKKSKLLFIDIFDYIDFDRTKSNGKLLLLHNGNQADFMKELKNGDEVVIKWI